jgi:hypothetical protein
VTLIPTLYVRNIYEKLTPVNGSRPSGRWVTQVRMTSENSQAIIKLTRAIGRGESASGQNTGVVVWVFPVLSGKPSAY